MEEKPVLSLKYKMRHKIIQNGTNNKKMTSISLIENPR